MADFLFVFSFNWIRGVGRQLLLVAFSIPLRSSNANSCNMNTLKTRDHLTQAELTGLNLLVN